ncbi:sensor histidine kinase [Aquabacterium sp. OR-4]|uniref:sensor histidine kinase n=1 Tax=Aquabacterium sp. OR-4 TaxID=2978127 RepID=UPI0021B368B6|nr:histidine kinase [Aquabacterium sp. OR-4]MDT7834814.1 histidine kinase [Aquabacterium sp. OR-4]
MNTPAAAAAAATATATATAAPAGPAPAARPNLWQQAWRNWHDWRHRPALLSRDWCLAWLCTLAFCMAIALIFTVIGYLVHCRNGCRVSPAGWALWYGRNLIVSLSIGALIHLMHEVLGRTWLTVARLRRWPMWRRSLVFTLVTLVGMAIGWPLGMQLAGFDLGPVRHYLGGQARIDVTGSLLLSLLIGLGFHLWFSAKARQLEAERRATEAQLKLMQGQIEPHFLFNTLAGVVATIEADPPRARQMLQAFTDHLRHALGALRRDDGPLADELALAGTYLQLMQLRMEDRLQVCIEAEPAAAAAVVPPLLLQPLIENAIHHGLEPAIDGGTVTVQARVLDGRLVLSVHDNGRGLDAPPRPGHPGHRGNGVALHNLRERLASRYGTAATLSVVAAHPGTRATLVLPLQAPPT